MNQINKQLIEEFYTDIIQYPNSCCEVRVFNAQPDRSNRIVRSSNKTTCAGWFTRSDELICELSRVENCSCYITVNPVELSRRPSHAKNTLKVLRKGEFATDNDILLIRYLIVDIDPPSKDSARTINSTSEELLNCISVRNKIISDINIDNNCIAGISGNGAFILISLPDYQTDSGVQKTAKLTQCISNGYSSELYKIDVNTKNPSRLLAIPGTVKFRNPVSTSERPHRRVEILVPGPHHETSGPV